MALLEHTIDYQILEDQFRDKIILSSQAELCRAAHKALCQIAKSRASTFIITIGKFSTGHMLPNFEFSARSGATYSGSGESCNGTKTSGFNIGQS